MSNAKVSAMTEAERIQHYTALYENANNDALEDKLIAIDATVKAMNALSKSIKTILGERLDVGTYTPVKLKVSTEEKVPNLADATIQKDYSEYVRTHADEVAVWSKFVTQKSLVDRYKKSVAELLDEGKIIVDKTGKKFKV